jgi:hypothetical protein
MNNINHTIRKIAISLFAIIALGVSAQVLAQTASTSDIHGSVTGISSGEYTISATEDRTGKLLTKGLDDNGFYRFPALTPGVYTVNVLKDGHSVA